MKKVWFSLWVMIVLSITVITVSCEVPIDRPLWEEEGKEVTSLSIQPNSSITLDTVKEASVIYDYFWLESGLPQVEITYLDAAGNASTLDSAHSAQITFGNVSLNRVF